MSRISVPHFDNRPDPHFKREGPFPFFDLPTEVRDQILSLLLARGKVALGKETSIRNRFSNWKHEKPMWQLLRVNSQLRAEARAVLFSPRHNTFYLPIGDASKAISEWSIFPLNTFDVNLFAVPKFNCAFDMRDLEYTTFNVFEDTKRTYDDESSPGQLPFEQLLPFERMDILHDSYREGLLDIWVKLDVLFSKVKISVLQLDISKARCPFGCCRFAKEAVGILKLLRHNPRCFPERIEIFGALQHEKENLKNLIEDHDPTEELNYRFVDTPGCTCGVSPRES